jgi:hypothetical protein
LLAKEADQQLRLGQLEADLEAYKLAVKELKDRASTLGEEKSQLEMTLKVG